MTYEHEVTILGKVDLVSSARMSALNETHKNYLRKEIEHNYQSINVIFGAPHLVELGLMAGVRRNFGKSRVLKTFYCSNYSIYFPLCLTETCYHYSYIEGFMVIFLNEI